MNICIWMKRKGKKVLLDMRKKTLEALTQKRQKKKKKRVFWRAIERSWRKRENMTKLIYQTLKTWNFQISIGQEESSSDEKKVLKFFGWLRSNWIGIKRDRDFWPKNWIFLIGRGSTSIDRASEKILKIWKSWKFCKKSIKNQILWNKMHMNAFKIFQKQFALKFSNFSQNRRKNSLDLKISKTLFFKFNSNQRKCIKHHFMSNQRWPD